MPKCKICDIGETSGHSESQDRLSAECSNCGRYRISKELLDDWQYEATRGNDRRALLAHLVRRRSQPDAWIQITPELVERVVSGSVALPGAIDQLTNLICWLAENKPPGKFLDVDYVAFQAVTGSASAEAFMWVLKTAIRRGFLDGDLTDGGFFGSLTLDAWVWHAKEGRHRISRQAFMAMPFGFPELNSFVDQHFRPAVRRSGFELRRLDDAPEAGVIDNRLRVEIRRSRLLIAELTHANHGAYFEAGFAEGLGIPVIYTCEKSVLDNGGVHFDTRNAHIVSWTKNQPELAGEQLAATIRNTLPEEAILEDQPDAERDLLGASGHRREPDQ